MVYVCFRVLQGTQGASTCHLNFCPTKTSPCFWAKVFPHGQLSAEVHAALGGGLELDNSQSHKDDVDAVNNYQDCSL